MTWPTAEVEQPAAASTVPEQDHASLSIENVYVACFAHVARWVRALGANEADVEDVTQEVFIVVRRKLAGFDGRNLLGFLYRITERTVRDHRRSAWIRKVLRNPAQLPELPASGGDGLHAAQEAERRKAVEAILAKMSDKRRTTFILYEIEGYSGKEIAQIQSLPLDTVWTRLHHARKDFLRLVQELAPADGEA